MKRVLILAYYFPPLGGVGAHRPVKLAKHLREFGFEPTFVTGDGTAAVAWAPGDPALADDVPADVTVLRASPPSKSLTGAGERVRRWLGLWSPFQRWWRAEAVRVARDAAFEADVILATMSPFSTAGAAADLSRATGKPWVADLQDPWALDEWTVYPTALHRTLDKRRMRGDLRTAAAIVMNTADAARALVDTFPELADTHVTTVTQGWDSDDFRATGERDEDGRFRIVYAGYSHVQRGRIHETRRPLRSLLGGSVRGMDILTRSHVYLLEALERLRAVDPGLAARIELHLAGAAPPSQEPSESAVTILQHGYLRHDVALTLMSSADVLFLPMHDMPAGVRARTVPGKTYEYLASGRPILAAVPDGDARDLLARRKNVWLVRPDDAGAMARALSEIARSDRSTVPRDGVVEQFEWRRLVGRIAEVMNDTLRTNPRL